MNFALIFAGGTGSRMKQSSVPKQFMEVDGKPIIIYTLEHFENHPLIDGIAVVCLKEWIPYLKALIEKFGLCKVRWITEGGETGQASIRNGLKTLVGDPSVPSDALVLIHDGVRPLIDAELIGNNISFARQHGNAITMTPAIETIISVSPETDEIESIMDRSIIRYARAPQTFFLKDIWAAHLWAQQNGMENMIDSAILMSSFGAKLHVLEGPAENIKITTLTDFYTFKGIIEARKNNCL